MLGIAECYDGKTTFVTRQDRTVLSLALTKQPQAKAGAIQSGPVMN
jgi:hypothetical protein